MGGFVTMVMSFRVLHFEARFLIIYNLFVSKELHCCMTLVHTLHWRQTAQLLRHALVFTSMCW
jgi:hypothetical protein